MKTFSSKKGTPAVEKTDGVPVTYSVNSRRWIFEPVKAFFGTGEVHYCYVDGYFDLDRMAETFADRIVRSWYSGRDDPERGCGYWVDLCIRLDETSFALVDDDSIAVYADRPDKARRAAEKLKKTFSSRPRTEKPAFQIVKRTDCGIDVESVALDEAVLQTEDSMRLHYGGSFPDWHVAFVASLRERRTGLTVLDGPPGTGKTSYLRHLMAEMRETHRFYFIASSNLHLLRDPEFVDFWAGQRRTHAEAAMVVILEDAEMALMPRGSDNRQEVSLLLNITDGILGEFLKLQVICTVNCALKELDSALLRPGRLMAHRHFGRLDATAAAKIAANLGKPLPEAESYTLAEIFSGQLDRANRPARPIGFGA